MFLRRSPAQLIVAITYLPSGDRFRLTNVLTGGKVERFALLALFAFLLLLFALFGALAHRINQRALFLLQIFLTVGSLRRRLGGAAAPPMRMSVSCSSDPPSSDIT